MTDRYLPSEQQVGAMRSSIAWALLGLVIERPSYGYELVQRFRRAYGDTIVLSSSTRIYAALNVLEARALIEEIEGETEISHTRHPRPRYRVSAQGVGAYQDWLLSQLEESRARERLFARQLAMLMPQAALAVIDRYEQECLTEADESTPAQTARDVMAERLADQDEQLALQAKLSWIRYARHELTELADEGPDEDPTE